MGTARFTVVAPECVRMEYVADGGFADAPSLFAIGGGGRRAEAPTHVVADGDGAIGIDTGRMVVRYTPTGGGFTAENLTVTVREGGGARAIEWRPGTKNTGNLGGTLETLDRVRGHVPLPDGVLSRDGWFLHDDSRTHLLVDGWPVSRPAGATDWYFFGYGSDYRAALKALAAAAGPVPMPRRYALGSWYSRYWPYTSGEYREIIGEYDRRGYPLDVIVMDMDWHKPGWTGWSWNRELLPDAEELLEWFHDNGLAVTLNLHPADGVGPHEDQYPAFMRAIGRDPTTKETVPFDAGDQRYAGALFKEIHEPLERDGGVDFWWLDWQQDKFTRSIPDLTNLWWLNYLYFNHTKRHARRGCSFSRWAGWGDHRHPVHFSGDAHTGWDSLAFQVPFTAVAGNVGCFFWSHDIGGHFGPRLEEATARWVQFGALSPVLRLHSARSGALDRKPWSYEEKYERSMHAAFRLRAELFPYIYTMARKCHTEMLPLCRPMYIGWPSEDAAYENPQQYMFGDSLLVAPITSPGVGPRKAATQAVWFPDTSPTRQRGDSASAWFNYHTGERYEAGAEQLVAAEIDEIPMFVPGGVPIVTRGGEPTLRMATEPLKKLVIVCYPGEPGSYHEFELYEDDGISDAHERGAYSVTPVRAWWFENELKLDVGIRVGSFAGMVEEREVVLELRGVERATAVRVDERALGAVEGVEGRVRIEGGKLGAEEVLRIAVRFEAQEEESVRDAHAARRCASAYPEFATLAQRSLGYLLDIAEGSTLARSIALAHLAAISSGVGIHVADGVARIFNGYYAEPSLELDVEVVDRIGSRSERHSCVRTLVGRGQAARPALPSSPLSLPPLGLRAARSVSIRNVGERWQDFDGPVLAASALIEAQIRPLRSFRVLGPFRYDPTKPMYAQRHGPELLPAAQRLAATCLDMNAKPVTWVEAPPADYWPQAIRKVCGGHNGEALAYSLTHVWSPEEQEVTLLLESGDRLELWVGDERVFSSDEGGQATESAVEEVRATLRKGWNQFMGKTNEGGGGWGFRVSIDGTHELRESFEPSSR